MVVLKCLEKLRILNQQIDDLEKEIAALDWYVKDNPGRKSERESEWLKDVQTLLVEAREVRVKVREAKEQNKCSIRLNPPDAKSPDLLCKEADQISGEIFELVQQARKIEIPISYRQDKNAVDGFQDFGSRSLVMENIMNELKKPEIKMNELKEPEIKMNELKEPEIKMNELKKPEIKMNELKKPEIKCRVKLRILNQQIDDLEKEIAALDWYVKDNPGRKTEQEWLDRAQNLLIRAKNVRDEVTKAKERNKCSIRLNPDARSPDLLCKEADETSNKIFEQVQQARKFKIPISYRQDKNAVDGFQEFDSRSLVMKNIMNELKKPEIKMIGVHGNPGIGKTLLLREIKREIERRSEKEFDAVVMVTVSKNPNLSRIRDEIARGLGIYPFSHKLASLPPGTRTRDIIKGVLIEKKVLLILDDIWTRIDLEELGIPLPKKNMACCKVLLTYRDEDKGSFLSEMGCQSEIQVLQLKDEEAEKLFSKIASDQSENLSKELFSKIASDQSENLSLPIFTTELAEMCKGLPIAVAALANALKDRSLIEWMTTLKKLQSSVHEEICQGMTPSLDLALRSSYSVLKNKQEFLLCCLLGRNATIRDLLNYGTGLGLFSADKSRKESWEEALALVRDSCLLLDGFNGVNYDMNALVRDFAVAVASKEFGVFAVRDDRKFFKWPNSEARENLKWIYITKCDMERFPDELECPQLTFFHLSNNESSLEIPPDFFKGTKKLQVLGLTEMRFSSIPSSIRYLKGLCTLRLDQCQLKGSDIGLVIGELVTLQVLSLAGCDIEELPNEIAHLTKLKVLNLSDCCDLKVIPPGVLSRLTELEELYMGNSFDQWCDVEEHGDKKNASAVEFMHPNLTAIEVCIKSCDTEVLLKKLFSAKLVRYKVFIGDVWNYWGCSVESSNVLKLKLDARITIDDFVKKLLEKTDELHLEGVTLEDNVLKLVDEGFQKLRFLLVEDARKAQRLVNSEASGPCNAFPLLEILVLRNLPKLEKISNFELDEASFRKLSKITVENCHQLKNLFSFEIASHLSNLLEIVIVDCENIVEIVNDGGDCENIVEIVNDGGDETGNEINAQATGVAAQATGVAEPHELLRSLRLQNLKKFAGFNNRCTRETLFNEQVDFPKLKELHLSCINFIRIWDSPATSYSIQNLTKLIIEGCNDLQYAFSSTLAKVMVNVRHLEINECKKMSEIVSTENVNGSSDKICFRELSFLQINKLENVTGFCSKSFFVEFPSLKKLTLKNCPKMKGFTFKLTDTDVEHGMQPLFDKQVSFGNLEKLTISHLINVKMLWQSELREYSFSRLKSLTVRQCEELLAVFPSNDMYRRFFSSLELLGISRCGSLRAVFDLGELDASRTRTVRVKDTELRVLFLSRLHKLKCVWNEDPERSLGFKNLQSVVVQYCEELKTLFPASLVRNLSNLEHLKVRCCGGVKEIKRRGRGEVYRFLFSQGTQRAVSAFLVKPSSPPLWML